MGRGVGAAGIGVDRPVEAGAAIKLIVTAQALKPVVLAKTKDRIRLAGPDQRIPRRRADDAVRGYEVAGDKRSQGDILQCKGIAIAEIDDRVGALLGGSRGGGGRLRISGNGCERDGAYNSEQ